MSKHPTGSTSDDIKSRFNEMFGNLNQGSIWNSYKLSELFDLTMGKTPFRDEPRYWEMGTHPWVSISDITSCDGIIVDTKEKISDDAVSESGIKQINSNTVLMSFKLSIGKTALTQFPLYTNEAIVAFVPRKTGIINNAFLQEWIRERDWSRGSNKAVKGITLNKTTLKEIPIPVPPIELQDQFAYFVQQVNNAKAICKQIFESFDNLIKSRFIEMFSSVQDNKFKWPKVNLGSVSEIVDGEHQSPPKEETGNLYLMARNITKSNVFDLSKVAYVNNEVCKSILNRCYPEPGDLLLTNTGTIGNVLMLPEMEPPCLDRGITLIKYNRQLVKGHYLMNQLLMPDVQIQINQETRTSAIAHLFLKQTKSLQIVLPPIELQNQFAPDFDSMT